MKKTRSKDFSTPGNDYSVITEVSYEIGEKDLAKIEEIRKVLNTLDNNVSAILIRIQDSDVTCYEGFPNEYRIEVPEIKIYKHETYIQIYGKYAGDLTEIPLEE